MIDSHCHLEQKDYNEDREEIISKCKKEMRALITSCAHPKNFEFTIELVKKYPKFVYASFGIHPEYIKELTDKEIDNYIQKIRDNKKYVSGIGEIGIDFFHTQEEKWRKKQEELFIKLINVSKDMKLPLIIHSRDGHDTTLRILEQENTKRVYWHMFGAKDLLEKVIQNGYCIGANAIILKSKKHKKIIRDAPLEKILTETDAPWLHPHTLFHGEWVNNTPLTVKDVIKRIAKIKKMDIEEVDKVTTENAIRFYGLKL